MITDDWEFNIIGVYNYRKPGAFRHYFDFIIENHDRIAGDICEAGVFKGRSLLATGLLLKELGSSKQVYGFDNFRGFSGLYHEYDDISMFDNLLSQGKITDEHHRKIQRSLTIRSWQLGGQASVADVSTSGDFSGGRAEDIMEKARWLGLDNIHLVEGDFAETMIETQKYPSAMMAALVDCDLYASYQQALPFIWDRLSIGGYVYLDEYYSLKFAGAKICTDEFFENRMDKPQIHKLEPGEFERWYVRKLFNE